MKTTKSILAITALFAALGTAQTAQAGPDEYIGQIIMMGSTFCPRGTANLDGQLLPISQNQALFSLLGTTYGGDGRTTFALPDMRGRSPLHVGNGPGLTQMRQGQKVGSETSTLTPYEHTEKAQGGGNNNNNNNNATTKLLADAEGPHQTLNNRGPSTVIRYCMTVQGIFPSRS